jgi:hypothetical protein
MRRESLLATALRELIALVLVVVACLAALHWVYERVRPFLWLVVVIGVLVAATWLWRRVASWRL